MYILYHVIAYNNNYYYYCHSHHHLPNFVYYLDYTIDVKGKKVELSVPYYACVEDSGHKFSPFVYNNSCYQRLLLLLCSVSNCATFNRSRKCGLLQLQFYYLNYIRNYYISY